MREEAIVCINYQNLGPWTYFHKPIPTKAKSSCFAHFAPEFSQIGSHVPILVGYNDYIDMIWYDLIWWLYEYEYEYWIKIYQDYVCGTSRNTSAVLPGSSKPPWLPWLCVAECFGIWKVELMPRDFWISLVWCGIALNCGDRWWQIRCLWCLCSTGLDPMEPPKGVTSCDTGRS